MSFTVPHSAIGLSDRLAQIIEGLCGVIAARGAKDRPSAPLIGLAWTRLRRLSARFASLAAKVRDGRLAAAPVRRRSADPALALAMPPASPPEPFPATPGLPVSPLPPRWPRRSGWLLRLTPNAAAARSQVEHLLADPEMAALLAEVPQAGRILRPLCHMLGIRPGPALRLARHERPAPAASISASGRPAASGRSAVPGGWPPDAPSRSPERPRPTRIRSPEEPGADPPLAWLAWPEPA